MLSKMSLLILIRDMTVAQTSYEALTDGAKYPFWWRIQMIGAKFLVQWNDTTVTLKPGPSDLKLETTSAPEYLNELYLQYNCIRYRHELASNQPQLHSAHFCATPIIDLYITLSVCLCSVLSFVKFWFEVCLPGHIPTIRPNYGKCYLDPRCNSVVDRC